MSFSYLLLGHLLGDFTFQTDKIAEYKNKKWRWNLFHTLIVTLSMLIFSIPFGGLAVLLVMVNGILHYFIDSLKSKLSLNHAIWSFLYFLLDQALHIFIIYILSLFIISEPAFLFLNEKMITFLIAFIFTLSFSSIFNQYLLKIIFPDNDHRFFKENERMIGNFSRITAFLIFTASYYTSILFFIFIPISLFVVYYFYRIRWSAWMKQDYFIARLIIDYMMAFVGMLILFTT